MKYTSIYKTYIFLQILFYFVYLFQLSSFEYNIISWHTGFTFYGISLHTNAWYYFLQYILLATKLHNSTNFKAFFFVMVRKMYTFFQHHHHIYYSSVPLWNVMNQVFPYFASFTTVSCIILLHRKHFSSNSPIDDGYSRLVAC